MNLRPYTLNGVGIIILEPLQFRWSKLSVLSSTLIDFLPFFIFAFSLISKTMQNAQPIYFRGTYVPSCSHAMMLRECMDDVFAYPLYIKLLLFCLKRRSMIFQTPSILYLTKMIIICEQLPFSMIFSELYVAFYVFLTIDIRTRLYI